MSHAIELGYLRRRGRRPRRPSPPFFTDIIGLAPGEPTPSGELTWSDDDAAPADHRRRRARPNDLAALGFEAVDAAAFDADRRPARPRPAGRRPTAATTARAAARRVERLAAVDAPWGSPVEVVLGLERTADAGADAAGARRLPHRGPGLRPRRGRHHRVRRVGAVRHRGAGHGAVGLAGDGARPRDRARGPLLPLQRPPPHPGAGPGAVRAAPAAAPRDVRDQRPRRRGPGLRPGLRRRAARCPTGSAATTTTRCSRFYVASPAGFQVEVGHGARQIAEPWTDDRRYDRISAWGHQPVVPDPDRRRPT